VTLSLVGLTTSAQAKACEQEYKTVQAGLDAYMAYNNVDTVAAASNNDNMAAPVLLYNAAGAPTFVRNSPTNFAYTWDVNGRITGISPGKNSGPVPTGCVVSGA